MNLLALLFALLMAALLQALFPASLWTGGAPVPIMPSLVVYYALMRPRPVLLTAAVGAGLIEDSLSPMPLGYSVFCYCVVGLLIERWRENVLVRQWTTHVAFGALVNGGVSLALLLLLAKDGLVVAHPLATPLRLLGAVVLGGLVAPLVFQALEGLERMLGMVEAEEEL